MVISKPIRGGKTLKKNNVANEQVIHTTTTKQRVMMFAKKVNKPFIIRHYLVDDLNMGLSKRHVERAFNELAMFRKLKREKCPCECAFLYSLP